LLDNVARFLPGPDRMSRGCEQVSFLVEDPCPRARGSNIDADKSLPHGRSRQF
jgi:hypothetical protein